MSDEAINLAKPYIDENVVGKTSFDMDLDQIKEYLKAKKVRLQN